MHFEQNAQSFLSLGAMAAYVLAAIFIFARQRTIGHAVFFLGFASAVAAFAYRWNHVQHIPLQNMFEVFLCLGMLIYPISIFSRKFLKVNYEEWDAVLGVIVLFPAIFVFRSEPEELPPALQSWLFAPHVLAYMLSYMILAKAAVQAVAALANADPAEKDLVPPDQATYRMICFGYPLLTLGLVLGAVWGKIAWGDYWNWDPKELWSLVSWVIYLIYLHLRYAFGGRRTWSTSILAIAGFLAIVTTLLVVNLMMRGLHSYAD